MNLSAESQKLPVVFARGGAVRASSRDVASYFEKAHRNVLHIDRLRKLEPTLCVLNFEPTSELVNMPNGGQRVERAYEMDRDGFTLLAMGFTGEKALHWKLLYIAAFNAMEQTIKSGPALSPRMEEIELINAHTRMIGEARRVYGRAAARMLWEKSPLPQVQLPASVRTHHAAVDPEDDGAECLAHLLRSAAGNGGSIGALIRLAFADSAARAAPERLGIKVIADKKPRFAVAERHPRLAEIFAETPWADDWAAPLLSLDGAFARLTGFEKQTLRAVHLTKATLAAVRLAN